MMTHKRFREEVYPVLKKIYGKNIRTVSVKEMIDNKVYHPTYSLLRPDFFKIKNQNETECYCLPTCMQMIFAYFGIEKERKELFQEAHQAEVAKGLRTTEPETYGRRAIKTEHEGIGSTGIMHLIRNFGSNLGAVISSNHAHDPDHKKQLLEHLLSHNAPIILNHWSKAHYPEEYGHYSVAIGFTNDRDRSSLILADPVLPQLLLFNYEHFFNNVWYDPKPENHGYCVGVYHQAETNSVEIQKAGFKGRFIHGPVDKGLLKKQITERRVSAVGEIPSPGLERRVHQTR